MKGNLKASLLVLLIVTLCLGFSLSAFAQAKNEYTIYVVVHGGIADPFWKVCEKGALDAGALYPDLKVI